MYPLKPILLFFISMPTTPIFTYLCPDSGVLDSIVDLKACVYDVFIWDGFKLNPIYHNRVQEAKRIK